MAEEMTRQQYDSLAADLAELEGPKRAAAVEAIKVARGYGDLSENFEYHSAKNEQGLLERRITMLRARLEGATVVESGGDGDVVAAGAHIIVENEAGERIEIELSPLGGDGTASPSSPLGAAVLGKRLGDTVDVRAPRGTWRATIVAISA
jgi:transcription elongation factor GreA